MRTTTSAELNLLHSFVREEKFQVKIKRKATGDIVDLTDRIISISVDFSADEPVAVCDVTFDDSWVEYGATKSLNPLIAASAYNSPSPLLWPENELYVYVGLADYGQDVTDYKLLFHGVLGDDITPSGTKSNRKISIRCRDPAKRLQDRWIVGELLYGSEEGTSVVAVIQAILNDAFGEDNAPQLLVKDNPNFMIYPVRIGKCSVWDAINNLLKPTGYQVRYWYWPAGSTAYNCEGQAVNITTEDFYLTVIDPKRDKSSADDSLSADTDTITEESLGIADDTVRNDFWIKYYDRDTKQYMEAHFEDMDSIATYGRRTMVVGQDDVPYIDTYAEAEALAAVLKNDLSEVPATDKISCQLMYHIEPFDLLDVTNARLATGTSKMGVVSITHRMEPGQAFTSEITGVRDRVIGQVTTWLVSGGEESPPQFVPPPVSAGSAQSVATMLPDGTLKTETILEVVPPPEFEVEEYHWIWAKQGESIWHEEVTKEPILRLMNLPPGTVIVWDCRPKYRQGR